MNFLKYIKEYYVEIILTIFVFSNLYTHFLPTYLYYISIFYLIYIQTKLNCHQNKHRGNLSIALVMTIIISSLINSSITGRVFLISMIFVVSLMLSSFQYFKFKVRFLHICFWGFAFTSILNFFAHLAGINYRLLVYEGITYTNDFSGFTWHPMWLSAASGIGTIFIVHLFINSWEKSKSFKSFLYLPLILCSVYTTIQGASRSALACSLVASFFLIYISRIPARKRKQIYTAIVLLGIASFSFLMNNSERMQQKQRVQNETGVTSRDALWEDRIEEFASSPLWGIGFSASGVGENKKVGRVETGSGWLTVLAQTGIIGFILVVMLIKKAFIPIKLAQTNKNITLIYALFIYMCLHTSFEAYLFQGGWYLCFIFWLVVGVLDDYRIYYKNNM